MATIEHVWVTVSGSVGPTFKRKADAMLWLHGMRAGEFSKKANASKRVKRSFMESDGWNIGEIVETDDSAHFETGSFLQAAAIRRTRLM